MIKYSHIFKTISLLTLTLLSNLTYSANCLSYPSYKVDSRYFKLKDKLDELKTEHEYISREDYLNKKFGFNNWSINDKHFLFTVPSIKEGGFDITFTEKLKNTIKSRSIMIIAEIIDHNENIYWELINLNIRPEVSSYTTRLGLLTSANIFVVHSTTKGKFLVSESKQVKITPWVVCASLVRTQKEANRLNAEICSKIPNKYKKTHACN